MNSRPGWPKSALAVAVRDLLRRVLACGGRVRDVDARHFEAAHRELPRRAAPYEPMIVVVGLAQTSAVLQFDLASARPGRR